MTYAVYLAEIRSLRKTFLTYTSSPLNAQIHSMSAEFIQRLEVGAEVYASKLADLEEAEPAHAATYDEQCSRQEEER